MASNGDLTCTMDPNDVRKLNEKLNQLGSIVKEGIVQRGLREAANIVLKETNNRLVKSRELLVGLVTAGIVRRTTVEHVTTSVATLVLGDALSVGETVDTYH